MAMDEFAGISASERQPYFEQAAALLGLATHIVEKDFWVCWTLKHLFSLAGLENHLIFKGGTSLSKVYRVIERFSEDIDVSVSKSLLGFVDDSDPEKAASSKRRQKLIEELARACRDFVQTKLLAQLTASMRPILGEDDRWSVTVDSDDSAGHTLIFAYPTASPMLVPAYVTPMVKIELGARSDHWPEDSCEIESYLAEAIPQAFRKGKATVRVLRASRTFWEKATILHANAFLPEDKAPTPRQSRHYYDFYRLLCSPWRETAMSDKALLTRVAEHKDTYFRAAWARYDLATKGTLKLVPTQKTQQALRRDYAQMAEMFFTTPPAWDDIVKELARFEDEFNK
jgi:hypothetical protein